MKNAYFNDRDLAVMLSGSQLKVVSSVKSDVTAAKADKKYFNWLNKNCDWHYHQEAMLVLSGNTYFSLNGTVYPCLPGTFFLIDSKEKHDSYYPPFYDNFRHLWFRIVNKTIFTNTPYSKMNEPDRGGKNFNYTFAEDNYARHLFVNAWNRLVADQGTDREFDWQYLKHTVAGLLFELCRAGSDILQEKPELPTELHHKTVINAVAGHIRETGGKNLDIARLAYIAGYSKFHFARLFKEQTGCSVLEYINLARRDKYREFSSRGLNKKQISDKLGFSSPAAFSRWLKTNLPQ
jgi:AraC-like DNA-binding protein